VAFLFILLTPFDMLTTITDALEHILSTVGFHGELVVSIENSQTSSRILVDGREPHFLKFQIVGGMYSVAEAFLQEARMHIDVEPFVQFVGPLGVMSSFQVVRPGKLCVSFVS
jgi:hypothetical protein